MISGPASAIAKGLPRQKPRRSAGEIQLSTRQQKKGGAKPMKIGFLNDGAMATWTVCTSTADYPTYKGGARERLALKECSQPGIGQ